jgi:outer membrane protein
MRRPIAPSIALLAVLPLVLATPASAQDLPSAIADALAHAPQLAEARAGEAAASARLDAARAEGHPLVAVDGSIGTGRIDNGGFFGFGAATTTPLTLRAGAEMPLYAGGRVAAAMDRARGGLDVAHLHLADARSQTIVATVAAYAGVLSARRMEARFQQLSTELAEVERQATLRFQTGEIPASDLAAATARQADGEAALAQAQGQHIGAEAEYRRLTGHDAGTLAPLPEPPATPATLDEAMDGAHRANPALAEADKGIDIARAGVRAAKAERLPTVGAFAEATRTRDEFFPGYRADAVTIGLRGHWTLWAAGRTAAKIAEADAGLDASESQARTARDAIDTAVIAAWTGLATANRVVVATAASARAEAEALRSTRLEAKVGAKPTLAVLDAEREAVTADAAAITAEGQKLIAAWQLDALTGNLPQ